MSVCLTAPPKALQCFTMHSRFKDYHQEALAAFQAYKQFYTEQAVPLLTEQKEVESAMQAVEARAALDAEVLCYPTCSLLKNLQP